MMHYHQNDVLQFCMYAAFYHKVNIKVYRSRYNSYCNGQKGLTFLTNAVCNDPYKTDLLDIKVLPNLPYELFQLLFHTAISKYNILIGCGEILRFVI